MNQTKLEVALKNFSENKPDYRKDQSKGFAILGASLPVVNALARTTINNNLLQSTFTLPLEIPLMAAALRASAGSNMNRTQKKFDNNEYEGKKHKLYKQLTGAGLYVPKKQLYALDKYLPEDKAAKLNSEYENKLKEVTDKSQKKELKKKLMENKVDLFFENNYIGKVK